jgi:hypothetical protein
MNTLENKTENSAVGLIIMDDGFEVITLKGNHYHVPYACFPRLESATPEQLRNFEVCAHGRLLHWPMIDEDISVEHIVQGRFPVKTPSSAQFVAESKPQYGTDKLNK